MDWKTEGPAPTPETGAAQAVTAGDGGPDDLVLHNRRPRLPIPQPQITPRLLAVITVLLVIGALKLMAEVTLPLAFGLFLVAVFWPLQKRLQRSIGRGPAVVVTLLLFLAVVVAFGLALYGCYWVAARQWPQYAERLDQYLHMAQRYGVTLPGAGGAESGGGTTEDLLMRGLERTAGFFAAFTLVTGYLILGLLEVVDFRRKLHRLAAGDEVGHWLAVVERITHDFQRYILIRTVIGLITGVLVGLGAWLIGLDLAYIWGVTAFLLNYIPTIGTIIAMAPPVLFGLVQGGIPLALWTLGVLGGIQTVLGVYVDPMLQGRYLTPSPL
ncbi:MAG TPA: AI-2E family transporter, partial [Caldilineaceae bacterium]|nr:AI-2E family transporter [Caldilineaceae bacterium]